MTDDILNQLPPEYGGELLSSIREAFLKSEKTIVVLDDDPTGTQTCYDVTVLTRWTVPLLATELRMKPSILFILTNSRSLPEQDAITLNKEIGENLLSAVRETSREVVLVSRSDSTLRGHFPAEVNALAEAVNMKDAAIVVVPAFIEGGRFTINDVHYIREDRELIPVADTPFAKDAAFGYRHSNLKDWVEEKTKGRVRSTDVMSISLHDIRIGGPKGVHEKLMRGNAGDVIIVNACSHSDIEITVMGLLMAEKQGKKFIYRTSATFVPLRAGLTSGKILTPSKEVSSNGSLVVVGSYVPKTTEQLEYLLSKGSHQSLEIDVAKLLHLDETLTYAASLTQQIDRLLSEGTDVVIFTSRQLEKGSDPETSLQINRIVSDFLVNVVKGITVRPSFIVAKGGITSSDVASKALSAEKALIMGQVIPGVPLWKLDEKSKFPGIMYVVFPGNVGGPTALADVWGQLSVNS
jgi:uncharacterized protein YgbK (DUF1537 family)